MERSDPALDTPAMFDSLSLAMSASEWERRVEVIERVQQKLRALPKPTMVEGLRTILDQASRDPKWEVRRAVAQSLDLMPDHLTGEIEERLKNDACHDVRMAIERVGKRRKKQRRQERKLDNQSAQAARRLARMAKEHGTEIARAAEEVAWELFATMVRPVAHDLRHVMLDEPSAEEEANESLADRERRRGYTKSLINDLMDVSDPTAKEPERVGLRELVEVSVKTVRRKVGTRASARVGTEIVIDPQLSVSVPRGRLASAITNLILNAFEVFQTREGRITISAETTDRRRVAVLRISDDGPGISKKNLARIWLPGMTTKTPREGWTRHTGWGLVIVRRFIERDCRGSIEVASTVGVGTTFTIKLPIVSKKRVES